MRCGGSAAERVSAKADARRRICRGLARRRGSPGADAPCAGERLGRQASLPSSPSLRPPRLERARALRAVRTVREARSARRPRDRRPPRSPRPLLRGAGPRPRARRPIPEALAVVDVRRGRAADSREQLPRPADRPPRHSRARRPHPASALGLDERRRLLARPPPRRRSASTAASSPTPTRSPVDNVQLSLLIDAAQRRLARGRARDLRHAPGARARPARAPQARRPLHARGAYVERLVLPTIVEPLREDWENARAAALRLAADGKRDRGPRQACTPSTASSARPASSTRPAAPAISSTSRSKHMKRLEGEVTRPPRSEIGETQYALDLAGHTVDPHQFLGIELNPLGRRIAELVLWIGYLQWHFRTHGNAAPSEPVLRDFHNIECRDASSPGTRPPRASARRPPRHPLGRHHHRPPPGPGEPSPTATPASRSSTTPTLAPPLARGRFHRSGTRRFIGDKR